MAAEKKRSNGKFLWKVLPSRYQMLQKTFTEASLNDNMRTG